MADRGKNGRFLPGNKAGEATRFEEGNDEATLDNRFTPTEAQWEAYMTAIEMGLPHTTACKLVINPKTGNPISAGTAKRRIANAEKKLEERKMKVLNAVWNVAMDPKHRDWGNTSRFVLRGLAGIDDSPSASSKVNVNIDNTGENAQPMLVVLEGEKKLEKKD